MSNIHPKLSVVLCVNKTNPWLSSAIKSILTQDYCKFEFIIVANNCHDTLIDELNSIIGLDKRVIILRTSFGQLSYNLNYAADHATGDYIVRMDADDISAPCRLSKLISYITSFNVDIIGSCIELIDEFDNIVGSIDYPSSTEDIINSLPYRTVFCHPAVAIRKEFLVDCRGYLGGFYSEDTDLWIRSIKLSPVMINLPDRLLRYRIHTDQSTASGQGYPEVCSLWLRELLTAGDFYYLKGFFISIVKLLFNKIYNYLIR